jgi:hypothetical protein
MLRFAMAWETAAPGLAKRGGRKGFKNRKKQD